VLQRELGRRHRAQALGAEALDEVAEAELLEAGLVLIRM
jgi:hypothetical protein